MTSLVEQLEQTVKAMAVEVTDDTITIELEDGRSISVPTVWYPRLQHATEEERSNYEIDDIGVRWPDVEADFSIRGLLLGRRSGESPECFKYWLENRKKGRRVSVEQWLSQQSRIRRKKKPKG